MRLGYRRPEELAPHRLKSVPLGCRSLDCQVAQALACEGRSPTCHSARIIKRSGETFHILVHVSVTHSVTAKAIWYIESHLTSELSLEAIADATGVSRFHLSRAFVTSTGISLAGYARARRLSEAAKALAAGAPDVLAVALDAGYGSHEAFTRAARQHFGLTPEQLRAQGHLNNITLQEPIEMSRYTSVDLPSLSKPRIVKLDALLIFGLAQRCQRVGDPAIPSQWNSFLPHLGHIEGQIGNTAYGVDL